jgi:hypothetical protein
MLMLTFALCLSSSSNLDIGMTRKSHMCRRNKILTRWGAFIVSKN